MRVSNKMFYSKYSFNLMNNEAAIQKFTNQISTGKRIHLPSDDPIGTARAMSNRTRLTEIDQYIDNSNQAMSWLNACDDALMTLDSDLQRVRELVIAGANDTLTQESRISLAAEVDQIRDAIMQIANSNIDDRYVFAGDKSSNPPYTIRTIVSGDALNLEVNPIVIDSHNNEIRVKLDDNQFATITLTSKTYDGSPGNTLDDLATDIQTKLRGFGFDVPVFAKVNPDGQLVFYAGDQPNDGKIHTLVLKDGQAIKTTGTVGPPFSATGLTLDANANSIDNYYNGWTVTITKGKGAGQTRLITGYNGSTPPAKTITGISSPWDPNFIPDETSEYVITPPLEGSATLTGGSNFLVLPGVSSDIDDFYTGMDITFYDGNGQVVDTHKITGYNGTTHQISIGPDTLASTGSYKYVITPHLEGNAAAPAAAGTNQIQLAADASQIDDFYNGASITVTNMDGTSETHRINNYAAGPPPVITIDGAWKYGITAGSTYKVSDTALSQLGFENKATTKELVGASLKSPILVMGKYPLNGNVAASTAGTVTLDTGSVPDSYTNWTIRITSGPGAGQTATLTGFAGGTTYNIAPAWVTPPGADSTYSLEPPLVGSVQAGAVANNEIRLAAASSMIPNFYVGMPISITDGAGKSQTRIITSYNPATQIATVDSDWATPPDSTSSYAIDANYYQNANNKFQIKVGTAMTQEISLDGGSYTPAQLARMVELKIQERGGVYASVHVYATSNGELRIVSQDPDLDNQDAPLSIALFSGSSADALALLGFTDGQKSETGVPNYEGDRNPIEYEVNVGVKMQINIQGNDLFDPIFKHLTRISLDLRNNNTKALSEEDLADICKDIDLCLVKQGEIGAKVNRLQKSVDRFASLNENITKMLSDVEDTDLSKVIIDLTMRQTAYQAALQAGARIMPMSLLDFLK
ncbi:MAG: flagellar hook-associated protein FlgL [Bacteroidota bacterium]